MRIAINAISLQDNNYISEICHRLVKQHPEHIFIFLFDKPYQESFIKAENIIPVIIPPHANNPISFRYWYDAKAPLTLKAYKPDVWIQPYGFCSLSTRIPQLLVMHDLAFLHQPQFFSWQHRWLYKRYMPRYLNKAARIAAVSEHTRQDIIANYAMIPAEKIAVIPGAADEDFKPMDWQEKQEVKDGFADSREYFLFTGGLKPSRNLMTLLKAFSLFKKWQHSNMRLLVFGDLQDDRDKILEKLKSYKYREDVVLLGQLPRKDLVRVMATAYAFVDPSFIEGFSLSVAGAMQSGVPVISSSSAFATGANEPPVLYADPNDPDAIAKQMLLLYRDEKLRSDLITRGFERNKDFSWDKSAKLMWETVIEILKTE